MTHAVDLCFAKTAPPPTWGTFLDSHLRQWVSTGSLVGADGELSNPLCLCGFLPTNGAA
jgi:hypothetical protein